MIQHCSRELKEPSKAECLCECEESQMLNRTVNFHSKNHSVRPSKYAEEFWLRWANVGNWKHWSLLFPMHVFPTSPNPKSNFDAKRSGKLDGNSSSLMNILCNMTLSGNVQSLFSVVWPLLNFSLLGKVAYRLGVHWKKHIWGYISVKGLQKERRSEILYLVSYTPGKHVKALWSHECLVEFLWVVCCGDLWEEYMWWGKSRMGRGLYCVLGTLEVLSSSQGVKLWCTNRGLP